MEDQTGMQPAAPQAAPAVPVVKQVKELLSQDKIKEKFGEVLGQKAPQFMASITNTVSGSAQLKKCPANSIIGAAFVAATYDLPIDSNLGFAAIVPYNESVWNPRKKDWEKVPKAQFQMMYKGFIQLAIRSGYYERMNYAVVYKDELESYNPITGEIKFVEDFSNCKQRDAGDEANVAGYYAWFRLKTGYSQELYMSKKAVDNHTIDKYYIFYVYEPKKRMIMSIKFKHRVVQWAIYRVINPMLIKGYIKDSYGCIPERGPLTAMFRLKYWLEQVNRKDEQWYYLKLDISKYFYRISHRILKKILAKKIKDQRLLKLLESIIDCKHTPFGLPPGRSPGEVPLEERLFDVGMPIGNLLSQVFANVYLDALDQFCKRELQIHCYVRYMDDVIILSSSKAQLQEWKVRIASFLETELELQLNNKTCIRPINQGIEFVGYRVWPDKVVLRKKTTLHIKRVLKAKKEAYRVKEISFKQATDTLQSYLGMMKYCDCDALKEKILDDFVLTHADMKQIYEEGGDRDENYYRRGDGWSVEDYPVTDETYRPAGTCITAAWNY